LRQRGFLGGGVDRLLFAGDDAVLQALAVKELVLRADLKFRHQPVAGQAVNVEKLGAFFARRVVVRFHVFCFVPSAVVV